MKSILLATCGLAFATLLAAEPASAASHAKVVAAENFYGELVREIGGDAVDVTSILSSPDQDPHLFETAPSTARAIVGADIVIYNGADYDPWMAKLLKSSGRHARSVIVAADLIGAKNGDNPHLWYKPSTLPAVADKLAQALSQADPDDKATFEANLQRFKQGFSALDDKIASIRQKYSGTKVTATEPVFGYMATALGLDMLNSEFQFAMMNDTEPGPRTVAAFEKSLRDGSARILFYNSQVTDPTTEHLLAEAKDNGVAVVGVSETMPAGKTIQDWFSGQLDAVAAALDKAGQ